MGTATTMDDASAMLIGWVTVSFLFFFPLHFLLFLFCEPQAVIFL